MRRQQQANEIRTNIVYEFAVVSEASVRELQQDILKLVQQYSSNGRVIRLVGINLKKPTTNCVFLNSTQISVDSTEVEEPSILTEPKMADLPEVTEEETEEEEVLEDD